MSAATANPLAKEFYSIFYRNEPEVLVESAGYAILYKPHFMHSAPLREGEGGSLLGWFLSLPQTPPEARGVAGKKPVERGLLHRLDFATAGLVLVAKNQGAHSFLYRAQKEGRFSKAYRAFCDVTGRTSEGDPYKAGMSLCVRSRFRAFGPRGREVRPVFDSPCGEAGGRVSSGPARKKRRATPSEYSTNVAIEEMTDDGRFASLLCSLSLGFRHQVRSHLASIGLPICGDVLYNPLCKARPAEPPGKGEEGGELPAGLADYSAFMQLVAVSLSFPDPSCQGQVSFSLPQADRTSP